MNVFILCNKTKSGSYADTLFHLLIQFFQESDFIISIKDDVSEIREAATGKQNVAFVLQTGKKDLSFFTRLKLRSIVKKNKFDYFIPVTDSKLVFSNLPQLVISNDVRNYIVHKKSLQVSFAVCSCAEKQELSKLNESNTDPVRVISPVAEDVYQPVSWSEQQTLKMQYTQGREYFFVFAEGKTIHTLTELLKAFSTFKKWQHSNMKLVVAGILPFTETGDWKEKISTYKFREDVVLLTEINSKENTQVFAGSYAFVHIPAGESDVMPLLQAMQCETPCITFATESVVEYAGESAVVIEKNNYDQLAEKMILLYKDEALRSLLISKGKERVHHYTKEKTFAAFAEAFSLPVQ